MTAEAAASAPGSIFYRLHFHLVMFSTSLICTKAMSCGHISSRLRLCSCGREIICEYLWPLSPVTVGPRQAKCFRSRGKGGEVPGLPPVPLSRPVSIRLQTAATLLQ